MPGQEWELEMAEEDRGAIAARAFELFEARGGEDGRDHEDWLEAERQLREEGRIPNRAATEDEPVEPE